MAGAPPPVLGLDIGGTKIAAGVVTIDGHVHGLQLEPTRREEGPDAVIARLLDLGRRAVRESGLDQPCGAVGISCGGPLDTTTGTLHSPPHLPGWVDIPIGQLVRDAFGLPWALENDASAATLAEYRYGVGQQMPNLIYLTLSTGVGGGIVFDGRLHRGAAGNGGELGHLVVRPGGRPCSCRRQGCIEAYASGSAIAERAAERVGAGEPSALARLQRITAADVTRLAAEGDPLAGAIWDETTELLGEAITDLVNIIEPDMVVLGGGVARSGTMLLDPVSRQVAARAMPPAARAVRIELSALGNVVGVVGAGTIAFDLLSIRTSGSRGPGPAERTPASVEPSRPTSSNTTPDLMENTRA